MNSQSDAPICFISRVLDFCPGNALFQLRNIWGCQALPCIPTTTLSVGRESALSAPVQGDQQNYSLEVSEEIRNCEKCTSFGDAILGSQVQINVKNLEMGEIISEGYFRTPSGQ